MTKELLIVSESEKRALDKLLELFKANPNTGFSVDWAIESHLKKTWDNEYSALNSISMARFTKALYVGYELNKTKEEKLIAYYEYARNKYNFANHSDDHSHSAFLDGVLYGISRANAIMELGIKEVEQRDRDEK